VATPARLACAATALVALDALEGPPADAAERRGRALAAFSTPMPARQQWIDGAAVRTGGLPLPPLVLDGAHNREALAALQETLRCWGLRGHTLLLALMEDKLVDAVAPPLAALLADAGRVIALDMRFPRSPAPARLLEFLRNLAPPEADLRAASLDEALEELTQDGPQGHAAVFAGSLWMAGEVLKRLRLPGDGHADTSPATDARSEPHSSPPSPT
jgi:folylpolyglutamate synthase/dihydropteroate synthase